MTLNEMKLGHPSTSALFPPTIEGLLAIDAGLRISPNSLKTWWPGTELNRRRQPFQFEPKPFSNQQLNSSRWLIYCDHSVTSADVRLSVGVETFRKKEEANIRSVGKQPLP
jgi:hypothetical protein